MNGFLYWLRFYRKKYGAFNSHELIVWLTPTWIWYNLLTISHFWPWNYQLLISFNLWWCYCVLKSRNKANHSCMWYFTWDECTPFKIILWINETSIYATSWRSRCYQLHRLARLNTRARRYISRRHKFNIFAWQWQYFEYVRDSEMSQ